MNLWRPGRPPRPGRATLIRNAGLVTAILSILGLVAALLLVGTIAGDYRATVSVTRSAVDVIGETIASVDQIADGTTESLASAGASVEGAASTLDNAVVALEELAVFLEEDLPGQLESIRSAMPAAIQAANAIDGTLRALSLFGVDYDPEEPFGESLTRVEEALEGLPADLRTQSDAIRLLIPSAIELSAQTDDLASDLDELSESLEGFTSLTGRYEETLAEAQASVDRTSDSVESTIWLMRVLAVLAGLGGATMGMALMSVGDVLAHAPVSWRRPVEDLERQPREPVE
ncbi:MAG TPA: hypothetical protein VJ948_11495 [Acidimicrobiia bacterium]|nr:hypothetical protein [Acidimicrobiia bacterium]